MAMPWLPVPSVTTRCRFHGYPGTSTRWIIFPVFTSPISNPSNPLRFTNTSDAAPLMVKGRIDVGAFGGYPMLAGGALKGPTVCTIVLVLVSATDTYAPFNPAMNTFDPSTLTIV